MSRDLERCLPFTVERSEQDGDGLTMSGYAAVFNQPARIDSWEGLFDEVILPGAFEESLRAQTPVLMFEHGKHPLIGNIPIGRYTDVHEDERGLFVEARLHNNWLTEPIRQAILERSITGMSFRFKGSETVDTWTRRPNDVDLRQIVRTVVPEMGPVVFPAYEGTAVGVRNNLSTTSTTLGVLDFTNSTVAAEDASLTEQDLTGQVDARSDTGGETDTEPSESRVSPTDLARHRALLLQRIL